MIEVTNLTKSYDSIEAIRGISFEVTPGEVVGLLGPNGAGKSTTIRLLLSLCNGVCSILFDRRNSSEARRNGPGAGC